MRWKEGAIAFILMIKNSRKFLIMLKEITELLSKNGYYHNKSRSSSLIIRASF